MDTVQQHLYDRAKTAALRNLRVHGLWTSDQLPDLHLFAISKLLTKLDGVVAEVECTATNDQPILADAYAADGVQINFDALRAHFRLAVSHGLPIASASFEGWRRMSTDQLAEWFAIYLTAGINPTLHEHAVASGIKVAQQIFADERAKEI